VIDGGDLVIHTIYFNPKDFPYRYVVRAWTVREGEGEAVPDPRPLVVADSLEEARAAVPPGSDHLLRRERDDDPCIVESWI